jgi:hypothetical protein
MSDTILEVSKATEIAHRAKSSIDLGRSVLACRLDTPADKVVFEDTFVKLMQDIRRDAAEYIQMR